MGCEYGIAYIQYGGEIDFTHTPVVYVGGEIGELALDSDTASYAEVRDYLKDKGYVDSDFKIFYKAPHKGFQHLYSDSSSLELGGLIYKNGEVDIFVQHGIGVNENFVYDGTDIKVGNGSGLSENFVYDGSDIRVGSGSRVSENFVYDGSDIRIGSGSGVSENFVYDGTDIKVGSGSGVRHQINYTEFEDDTSASDEDYSPIYDGDSEDDEDIELNKYRKRLAKASAKKKRGVTGLGDAVEEITRVERRVQELKNEEGDDSAAEVDSDDSYETDSEGTQKRKKSKYEKFEERDRIPVFTVGMCFVDGHKQFKRAIDNYAIFTHRQIRYKRNDGKKIEARCVEGCKWRIYGSYNNVKAFHVRTYHDRHTCSVSLTNDRVSSKWLAKYYEKHFKVMPRLRPSQLQRLVHEELGVSTSFDICRFAKKRAMEVLYGEITLQYKRLWDYAEEIKLKNLGTTVEIDTDIGSDGIHRFRRLYVSFDACKGGFLDGCRKMIGIDGTFLKGLVKGVLLVAIGRDSAQQMFPIAWAQVEIESTSSWSWFMHNIKNDLGMEDGAGWVIISDQQKGLLTSIMEELPYAEHRCCARHHFCNWRKRHRGKEIGKMFWRCAKSPNMSQFEARLEELKEASVQAYLDILEPHPSHWAKAYFSTATKCDIVDNNLCEAFNGAIVEYRDLGILDMFDAMRKMVTKRMYKRHAEISKWKTPVGSRIMKQLSKNKLVALELAVDENGAGQFEVTDQDRRFVVDLIHKTCSCRRWCLSGIPCWHACAAIFKNNEEADRYVHPFLSKETCLHAYEYRLNVIAGRLDWAVTNNVDIMPPFERNMPGRPKKKRMRDEFEIAEGPSMSRKGQVKTCSLCKQIGHNKLLCPIRDNLNEKPPRKPRKKKGYRPHNDVPATTQPATIGPPTSDETYGKKYARYLQEREKYSKGNTSGVKAEAQIGTQTQLEVRISQKTRVAPKSKGLGLAPPPLPPGHSHWKGRGLTYNPDGRSGVSTEQIKKMRSPRKRGGASGWSSSTEKL